MSIYNRKDKGAAWLILFLISLGAAFVGFGWADSIGTGGYILGAAGALHGLFMVVSLFNTKKGA